MKVAPPGQPEPNPILNVAAEEIREILKKHDIAGVVLLFTPGSTNYAMHIAPSFSVVDISKKGTLQITPPILDPENEAPFKKKVHDTINMLGNLRIYGGRVTLNLTQAEMAVREHFNVMIPPGGPNNLSTKN